MSLSIGNVMNNYTYGYGNTLRPKIDSNSDGNWSKQEVNNYASAYEKSTGSALNVDDIFNKYDEDADGVLGYSEYENAIADDALGTSALYGLQQSEESAATDESDGITQLGDWLSTLTDRQKVSLTRATYWAESTANLFNAMFSQGGAMNTLNYALTQYNNTLYGAKYGSLMSSFDFSV